MENNFTPELFWNNIKSLLKEQNKTLTEMENDLSFAANSSKQWIFHKRYPNSKDTYLIAKYLRTSVEFLITGVQPENSDRAPDVIKAVKETLKQFE